MKRTQWWTDIGAEEERGVVDNSQGSGLLGQMEGEAHR